MAGTISMDTEQAIQVASTLNQNAKMLDEMSSEIITRINRLEIIWQGGVARDSFFSETTHLKTRIKTLTGDLFELYDRLIREIKEWEAADSRFGSGNRPINNTEVAGLFVRGEGDSTVIHPNDVYQVITADCYFMAALAALAATNPDMIREMITVNADGTYTVRFFNETTGKTEYVTIDAKDIPEEKYSDNPIVERDKSELWPFIIERAYAEWIDQRNIEDSAWSRLLEKLGFEGTDEYELISGGLPQVALQQLTGANSITYKPSSFSEADLLQNLKEGNPITIATKNQLIVAITNNPVYGKSEGQLVGSHAYYITGYDPYSGLVEIRNPWGWTHKQGTIYLPLEILQQNVQYVAVNDLTP